MQVPTDFTYGSNGLLSSTSTALLRVTYGYDERGNRTEVRAFNSTGPQLTTYTFDKANRLLSETNPLNQATVFTYDVRGNRETKLDAKGHLTRADSPTSPSSTALPTPFASMSWAAGFPSPTPTTPAASPTTHRAG